MALSVACYHGEPHDGLGGRTPGGVWAEKVAEQAAPKTVTNETAFLVDFLPVERRMLTRTGFQLDHVQYYSDALKPLIARRERLDRKVVLRRDPRDISRVWALHPETGEYPEVAVVTGRAGLFWQYPSPDEMLNDPGNYDLIATLVKESLANVHGTVNCDKPIIPRSTG